MEETIHCRTKYTERLYKWIVDIIEKWVLLLMCQKHCPLFFRGIRKKGGWYICNWENVIIMTKPNCFLGKVCKSVNIVFYPFIKWTDVLISRWFSMKRSERKHICIRYCSHKMCSQILSLAIIGLNKYASDKHLRLLFYTVFYFFLRF